MELLKGAPVASAITARANDVAAELKSRGLTPRLAIVRVGESPDDIAYENAAVKRCAAAGAEVQRLTLPDDVTQDAVMSVISGLNADRAVHGVLILRPMPKHLDEAAVCAALSPDKDVDGITAQSLAGVFSGNGAGFPPCTAQACIELLEHYKYDFKGARVVVVGRSLVVGKPAAMLLLERHATVTVCHTRTKDLRGVCKNAELLIVAAGAAGVVDESYLSPGQTVVDVGIHVGADGKLRGDVELGVSPPVSAYTPVPGGVGAVTAAVLAEHVVKAAHRSVSS